MCVFFPLILGLMAAIWPLTESRALALGWDAAWGVVLAVIVARMRRAPDQLGGVPLTEIPGRPCPACGGHETQLWMSGRTPLGLHCRTCDRRTPGAPT